MIRVALIILSLALMLLSAGCGKKAPGHDNEGKTELPRPTVESSETSRALPDAKTGEVPAGDSSSAETPGIVIRTDNPVSNQEAGEMLDEMDKQLTELINTLERLDDMEDKDLQY
jgi:hypothetical protein